MAGVTSKNVDYLAHAVHQVTKWTSTKILTFDCYILLFLKILTYFLQTHILLPLLIYAVIYTFFVSENIHEL